MTGMGTPDSDHRHDSQHPGPAGSPAPGVEPEFDPDVAEALRKAKALRRVKVGTSLRNAHPLVLATKAGLEQAQAWHDYRNLFTATGRSEGGVLDATLGADSIRRGLLFLNALIKGFEKAGCRVEVSKEERRWETWLMLDREPVMSIRLRERYTQRNKDPLTEDCKYSAVECLPSGRLVLEGGRSRYWNTVLCEDTEAARIEGHVNEAIVRCITKAGEERTAWRKREEEWKRQEAARRLRQEEERQRQRRQAKLEKRQGLEKARVKALLREAARWQRSNNLRSYLQHVEARAIERDGGIEEGGELAQWLSWARRQADRLDPVSRRAAPKEPGDEGNDD
jgi:hypothetical protein